MLYLQRRAWELSLEIVRRRTELSRIRQFLRPALPNKTPIKQTAEGPVTAVSLAYFAVFPRDLRGKKGLVGADPLIPERDYA